MYQNEFWYSFFFCSIWLILVSVFYLSLLVASAKRMLLANCFEKMMNANVIPYACNVNGRYFGRKTTLALPPLRILNLLRIPKGFFYSDQNRTPTILEYLTKCHSIYKTLCWQRKVSRHIFPYFCKNELFFRNYSYSKEHPFDSTITVRSVVNILNDLKIISHKKLTTKEVVRIFSVDNPYVFDSKDSYNLDIEVVLTFFFFYILPWWYFRFGVYRLRFWSFSRLLLAAQSNTQMS